jgi:hypothetical protein
MPVPEGKPRNVRIDIYDSNDIVRDLKRHDQVGTLQKLHHYTLQKVLLHDETGNVAAREPWKVALEVTERGLGVFDRKPYRFIKPDHSEKTQERVMDLHLKAEGEAVIRAEAALRTAFLREQDIDRASRAAVTGHLQAKYGIVQK